MTTPTRITKAAEVKAEFMRTKDRNNNPEVFSPWSFDEGVKVEHQRSQKLVEVLKNYLCPYCLDTQKEMAYPHCLEYQSCKALKEYEAGE